MRHNVRVTGTEQHREPDLDRLARALLALAQLRLAEDNPDERPSDEDTSGE